MNTEIEYEELYDDEEFRDSIATVDADGKRIWLYPKKPKGAFYNKRVMATIAFLAIFLSGPFIKIGGQPLLMMNFFERKFIIFGQYFLPQDFVIFGLGMMIFVLFIVVFTVAFGRVWCGWLCPQTVFMEMIFRPIENWLEGDGRRQKRFDEGPWNFDKIWRKTLKHVIFIAFSILIAHITMAYIIGIEEVKSLITHSPAENLAGFTALTAFTGVFYFVFSKLREQVCIAICPYGRLQGVLVNKDTSTVIYDNVRGEKRGRLKKNTVASPDTGDCIDCNLCVQVCPTGIDIRNGIQLECTNCTACIDACDDVMEKVNKPTGLIRYASVESVEKGIPDSKTSKRSMAYAFVLIALMGLEAALLIGRSAVETTVLRVPGQLYQRTEGGGITNLYNAQIVNKSQEEMDLELRIVDKTGKLTVVGGVQSIHIAPAEKVEVIFFLEYPEGYFTKRSTEVELELFQGEERMEELETNFFSP